MSQSALGYLLVDIVEYFGINTILGFIVGYFVATIIAILALAFHRLSIKEKGE